MIGCTRAVSSRSTPRRKDSRSARCDGSCGTSSTSTRRTCPRCCRTRSAYAGGCLRWPTRFAARTFPTATRRARPPSVVSPSTTSSCCRWGWRSSARGSRAAGIAMSPSGTLVKQLRDSLTFALTGAQERVWGEIRQDMASPYPMHRLLQGDVGSGKTIVAALAVLTAIEAGYQAAVMAPTEILAEQHYGTFRRLLEPLGLEVTLLTSALKPKERTARRAALAAGEIACAIGTHALVQERVAFKNLGLAVVDEQHRFGVHQRARLRGKGERPDLLVMTATPIPRTLALTLYGDLDVSVLDELPPGRQPIVTVARTEAKRPQIYTFLRDQIAAGRQIYVVYPLVEESEAIDLKAATDMARDLQEGPVRDTTVGLLHGRLSSEEKDEVMRRFKA